MQRSAWGTATHMGLFLAMGEISWLHLSSLHTEISLRFPEVQGMAKSWHVVCVRFLIVLFYEFDYDCQLRTCTADNVFF